MFIFFCFFVTLQNRTIVKDNDFKDSRRDMP